MAIVKHPAPDTPLTKEERHLVCDGLLCPECKGKNIERVGSNPDFINMNYGYDCNDCGAQWEGY